MDVIATASYAAPEMDDVSVFGFVVSFLTVVFLLYRREIKIRWPILGGLYSGLALYGFLAGLWPMGIVLFSLAVVEFCGWRRQAVTDHELPVVGVAQCEISMSVCESRLSRMFGR